MNNGRINSNIIHCKSAHYLDFFEIKWIWLFNRVFARASQECGQGERQEKPKTFPPGIPAPIVVKRHGNPEWMGSGIALFAGIGVIGKMAYSGRDVRHAWVSKQ